MNSFLFVVLLHLLVTLDSAEAQNGLRGRSLQGMRGRGTLQASFSEFRGNTKATGQGGVGLMAKREHERKDNVIHKDLRDHKRKSDQQLRHKVATLKENVKQDDESALLNGQAQVPKQDQKIEPPKEAANRSKEETKSQGSKQAEAIEAIALVPSNDTLPIEQASPAPAPNNETSNNTTTAVNQSASTNNTTANQTIPEKKNKTKRESAREFAESLARSKYDPSQQNGGQQVYDATQGKWFHMQHIHYELRDGLEARKQMKRVHETFESKTQAMMMMFLVVSMVLALSVLCLIHAQHKTRRRTVVEETAPLRDARS